MTDTITVTREQLEQEMARWLVIASPLLRIGAHDNDLRLALRDSFITRFFNNVQAREEGEKPLRKHDLFVDCWCTTLAIIEEAEATQADTHRGEPR